MSSLPVRAVFDTNIFIRALLSPTGAAGRCWKLVKGSSVRLFVSRDLLDEIVEVTSRPYLRAALKLDFDLQRKVFVSEIRYYAQMVDPVEHAFALPRDPKDEMVLNLAIASETGFIVTLDKDLLDLMTGIDVESKQFRQRFRHLKIVRPDEFLRIVFEREIPLRP